MGEASSEVLPLFSIEAERIKRVRFGFEESVNHDVHVARLMSKEKGACDDEQRCERQPE